MDAGLNDIIIDDLEWPLTRVTVYLQVEYLKNGAFRDKVTKEH